MAMIDCAPIFAYDGFFFCSALPNIFFFLPSAAAAPDSSKLPTGLIGENHQQVGTMGVNYAACGASKGALLIGTWYVVRASRARRSKCIYY
jgi:hypothetical protein